MRNSCSAALVCSLLSSSSLRLRIFSSSIVSSFKTKSLLAGDCGLDIVTLNEAGLEWQLVSGQAHRLFRHLRVDAFHLEQDPAGANDADPVIGSALALTHTGFGRLLRDRLVREQTQPHFAATLDETRHRDTAGFDLAVGD